MNLQIVSVAASGPITVTCRHCGRRATQGPSNTMVQDEHRITGVVWADLDGAPFQDYYCSPCAALKLLGRSQP